MSGSENRDQPADWTQRQRARERGDVPISREFGSALALAGSLAILSTATPALWTGLMQWTGQQWRSPSEVGFAPWEVLRGAANALALPLGLTMAGIFLVAWGVGWIQTGGGLYWSRLHWDLGRLYGGRQSHSSFGMQCVVTVLGLIRWVVVWLVVMTAIWISRNDILAIAAGEPDQWLGRLAALVFSIALQAAGMLALVGILDYLIQWWRYERRIALTPEEVRQELRANRIDPSVVQGRQRLSRNFVQAGLRRAISAADLMLVDATGVVVGLKTDGANSRPPLVVFRAAPPYSDAARSLAVHMHIPIETDPLAVQLYRRCRVGDIVSREDFAKLVTSASLFQTSSHGMP